MEVPTMYMTVEEAAELWKVRPARIIYTCECGGIGAAAKLSGQWIVPADIPRPTIKHLPRPSIQSTDEDGKRSAKHRAFIDAFRMTRFLFLFPNIT